MKQTRGLWLSILFVVALVAGGVAAYLTGTRPVLGLDLEGGVSVVLKAPDGTPKAVMDQALENIRNRIDALGVAEPQLFVSGTNVEVELPGLARGTIQERAKDQFCLIGTGGQSFGCFGTEQAATTELEALAAESQVTQVCLVGQDQKNLGCFATQAEADAALGSIEVEKQGGELCLQGTGGQSYGCFASRGEANDALSAISAKSTERFCLTGRAGNQNLPCYETKDTAEATLASIAVENEKREFCVRSSAGKNLGCYLTRERAQARLQETGQERLLQIIGTTARLEQREVLATLAPSSPDYGTTPVTCPPSLAQTPECSFEALRDQTVTFLGVGQDESTKYKLGQVLITGDAIKKATAVYRTASTTSLQTGWEIDFQLTSSGSKTFADVTTNLVGRQLAIVVDNRVISAPTVESAITGGSGVITGSFTERRAKDLATQLNAGALPVNLAKQQVVTVSPTLGRESLRQGVVAGIAGLVILALYLAFYYRLLGVVTWFGMSIWAILALTIVSILGRTIGYSLTLAGVAGLVVSLGITADSYIVFYERLKDEVRHGKTPRSAIAPAFKRSFRTILTADTVTFLAALILYLVAASSVRGFALTLGLSTLLDVFVVYFFKRPTVFLIARNEKLVRLRGFGLTSGVAADPVPAPAAGGSR